MADKLIRTARGWRLAQPGAVLSELLDRPGPTHSVFDVLAACIAQLAPGPRIGLLGFAAGGVMAPLRAMGSHQTIHAVDLERAGYRCFQKTARAWAGSVCFSQTDAVVWLRAQAEPFDLLVEDLSVPVAGDVEKPSVSWQVLPQLMQRRLKPGGIAVFNLLPDPREPWTRFLPRFNPGGGTAQVVQLRRYENRLLICGCEVTAARISRQLRNALTAIRSRQAREISVRRA